ncbi:cold shock domain-containing protein [Actinocorallia sp. API 0066]|uniref:cold-shock protein n=1 Tax=Actinocorallia sp. API 0066 TaxID=2896846 RepID=UPI001E4C26A6|nr:cold shock domain-containing protein [Actinocorallia sp. API 0066]MCD0450392.1 cold shock domain-containing protein [Actinocorallia sp. API 0066]
MVNASSGLGLTPGAVTLWHAEDGWGAISSPAVPGEIWVHFSDVVMDGSPELKVGESVTFSWEEVPQDEYSYRAILVFRDSTSSEEIGRALRLRLDDPPTSPEGTAFASSLEITLDEAEPPESDLR